MMMRAARQSKETPIPMYVITDKAKAASGFIGRGFRSLKTLDNPNWSKLLLLMAAYEKDSKMSHLIALAFSMIAISPNCPAA